MLVAMKTVKEMHKYKTLTTGKEILESFNTLWNLFVLPPQHLIEIPDEAPRSSM